MQFDFGYKGIHLKKVKILSEISHNSVRSVKMEGLAVEVRGRNSVYYKVILGFTVVFKCQKVSKNMEELL